MLQDLLRNAMKRLGIILMALLLSGCATLENFWDEEVLSPYLPGVQPNKQKNILVEGLNHWLGQPQSERIRVAGPPQGCVTLNTIGESCEWKLPWVERVLRPRLTNHERLALRRNINTLPLPMTEVG